MAVFFVLGASAQTPLRFIKLDPKSTPTSEVRMVTTITNRPLRQFPDEIRLGEVHRCEKQLRHVKPVVKQNPSKEEYIDKGYEGKCYEHDPHFGTIRKPYSK